jgi:hypothetical protein
MIYNKCTFMDCFSVFSPMLAYFLPINRNGEVLVLGKYFLWEPRTILVRTTLEYLAWNVRIEMYTLHTWEKESDQRGKKCTFLEFSTLTHAFLYYH